MLNVVAVLKPLGIGGVPGASFQIDLGQVTEISRFRLGRDRTGGFADRGLGELKIETSADGQAWNMIFHEQNLSALPGYRPSATMQIQVAPVQARWIRATVNPAKVCLDEFEIYRPADELSGELPRIDFAVGLPPRPVARTAIEVEVESVRTESEQEVLDLKITNKAKDYFIDQLKQDREAFASERQEFVEKLITFTRKVGELETKLMALETPAGRDGRGSAPENGSGGADAEESEEN